MAAERWCRSRAKIYQAPEQQVDRTRSDSEEFQSELQNSSNSGHRCHPGQARRLLLLDHWHNMILITMVILWHWRLRLHYWYYGYKPICFFGKADGILDAIGCIVTDAQRSDQKFFPTFLFILCIFRRWCAPETLIFGDSPDFKFQFSTCYNIVGDASKSLPCYL